MVMVLFLLLLVMDGVCGSVGSENVSEWVWCGVVYGGV